jgi:predicted metalloprotease with PDZ domain
MPEEKQKLYTIIAIAVLASLVLGCIAGALAGGVAGSMIARRQARTATLRLLEEQGEALPRLRRTPMPWRQELPSVEPSPQEPGVVPAPERQGALVIQVIRGTPAASAGLQARDLITAVDRTPVDQNHNLAEIIGQYEPGDRVTLRLWRAGEQQAVQVRLGRDPENSERAYLGIHFRMVDMPSIVAPDD